MHSLRPNPARRFDVVFCDVDGCLMPEDAHPADLPALAEVADYNRAALAHADRPVLIPCTGRPQPYAEAVCRALGCPLAACENGVWVYDFLAHRWSMDPNITPDHLAAVHAFERWVETELGPLGCFLQLGKHASATVFHDDVEWLAREIVPRIDALIAERDWPLRTSMTWTCINVDLKHVSKATAIDRIIATQHLQHDRLAGIGDTTSDLFIRERVAWFGCPANAADALKPSADMVADQPLARGVLQLLDAMRAPRT